MNNIIMPPSKINFEEEEDEVICPECGHRFVPENDCCFFIPFLLVIFIVPQIVAFVIGVIQPSTYKFSPSECKWFNYNYDYIIPAKDLGCQFGMWVRKGDSND